MSAGPLAFPPMSALSRICRRPSAFGAMLSVARRMGSAISSRLARMAAPSASSGVEPTAAAAGRITSLRLRTSAPGLFTFTLMRWVFPSRSPSMGSTPSR